LNAQTRKEKRLLLENHLESANLLAILKLAFKPLLNAASMPSQNKFPELKLLTKGC